MRCIQELRTIGYQLRLEQDRIICTWCSNGQPDPHKVGPLLAELKANKEKIVRYLQEETADLFLKNFKKALAELNHRYQPGTLDWIESHRPDLHHQMEQAEEHLDRLWREGNHRLFQEGLKRWQHLHQQAMGIYGSPSSLSPEFSDLVALLGSGQVRDLGPIQISPAETITNTEVFLRSYLRDLGHPVLKKLAQMQLQAFQQALARELKETEKKG